MASPKNNPANTDITIARPPSPCHTQSHIPQRPAGHQNWFPGADEGAEKQVLDELNQSTAEGAYNLDLGVPKGKDHEYEP